MSGSAPHVQTGPDCQLTRGCLRLALGEAHALLAQGVGHRPLVVALRADGREVAEDGQAVVHVVAPATGVADHVVQVLHRYIRSGGIACSVSAPSTAARSTPSSTSARTCKRSANTLPTGLVQSMPAFVV